ncbi:MAG: hypothetical protein JWP17_4036 [Solirubrobacterales bacterium]|jgi:hypothetical protein|nr:hypothetical protein [Solirubrobacterales bacterium]
MLVRVYLFHLDPDAFALPALVRGTLGEAQEERRGEREVLFRTESQDPSATMDRTIAELDRYAGLWRELVLVNRLA